MNNEHMRQLLRYYNTSLITWAIGSGYACWNLKNHYSCLILKYSTANQTLDCSTQVCKSIMMFLFSPSLVLSPLWVWKGAVRQADSLALQPQFWGLGDQSPSSINFKFYEDYNYMSVTFALKAWMETSRLEWRRGNLIHISILFFMWL